LFIASSLENIKQGFGIYFLHNIVNVVLLRITAIAKQIVPNKHPSNQLIKKTPFKKRKYTMKSKMKWEKTSKKMMDLFDLVLPKDPKVERKRMFGYAVRFTNLNMFIGFTQTVLF
jgi:hypothetical protein